MLKNFDISSRSLSLGLLFYHKLSKTEKAWAYLVIMVLFNLQPVRKQLFPTKLMAKGHSKPSQRPPQGNADWMKNLKEHNKVANRNR